MNASMLTTATATPICIDARLARLGLAAAWYTLVENGTLDLGEAFDRLNDRVAAIVPMFEECPMCGGRPCRSESWCDTCWLAEQEHRKNAKPKSKLPPSWNEMSLDALYNFINSEPRPTPEVTVEAIMYSVRERGVAALKEPDTRERLSRCDAQPRAEINRQIAALGIKGRDAA